MATLAEIIDADILATLNDFSGTLRWNGADYSVAAGDVQGDETLLIAGVEERLSLEVVCAASKFSNGFPDIGATFEIVGRGRFRVIDKIDDAAGARTLKCADLNQ